MRYWTSVRSRCPDVGLVLFCVFMDLIKVKVNNRKKKKQKKNGQPSSHLDRTNLANKWARKRELLIAGPTQKIPITQDSLILPDRGFSKVINDDNFSLSKFILFFVIHYPTTRALLIKTQPLSKTEAVNEMKINHDKTRVLTLTSDMRWSDPQCSIPRGIPIRP